MKKCVNCKTFQNNKKFNFVVSATTQCKYDEKSEGIIKLQAENR